MGKGNKQGASIVRYWNIRKPRVVKTEDRGNNTKFRHLEEDNRGTQ